MCRLSRTLSTKNCHTASLAFHSARVSTEADPCEAAPEAPGSPRKPQDQDAQLGQFVAPFAPRFVPSPWLSAWSVVADFKIKSLGEEAQVWEKRDSKGS